MAGEINGGTGVIGVELQDSQFLAALRRNEAAIKAWGKRIGAIGASIAALGTSVSAFLTAAGKATANYSAEMSKLSRETKLSAAALAGLKFAAEQTGGSFDSVKSSIKNMAANIDKGDDSLTNLGLSLESLRGMSTEEQFRAVADRLAGISDESQRSAAAVAVFGDSARDLLPLLSTGAAGIAAMQQRAEELGITMSQEDVTAGNALAKVLMIVKEQLRFLYMNLGAAVVPAMTELAQKITTVLAAAIKWVKENRAIIATVGRVAQYVVYVGTAIAGLGAAIYGFGAVFGWLAPLIASVGTALMSFIVSPVGLIVIALAAGVAAVLYFTDWLDTLASDVATGFGDALSTAKTYLMQLWTAVTDTVGAIGNALMAGDLQAAVAVAWAAIKVIWIAGVNGVLSVTKSIVDGIVTGLSAAIDAIATGLTGAVNGIVAGWNLIESGFHQAIAGVQSLWDTFVGGMEVGWVSLVAAMSTEWAKLKFELDEWIREQLGIIVLGKDPNQAKRDRDQTIKQNELDVQRKKNEVEGRNSERGADRQSDLDAKLDEIANRKSGAGDYIGGKARGAKDAITGLGKSATSAMGTGGDLAAAMQEWRDSIAAANALKPKDLPTSGVDTTLPQTSESKTSVAATFSARAAIGIAGANDAATTARNTTRMANDIHQAVTRDPARLMFS